MGAQSRGDARQSIEHEIPCDMALPRWLPIRNVADAIRSIFYLVFKVSGDSLYYVSQSESLYTFLLISDLPRNGET